MEHYSCKNWYDQKERRPERRHDVPKPVTVKCCRALQPSDKVDVNYVTTFTFLRVHRPLFAM